MTKSDPFASYKLPLGLTEGVEIPLPDTEAVFTVMLPGTMNEDFNMQMLRKLNATPDENGEVHVNTGTFQVLRKELFFGTCILSAKGLPKGMGIDEFFDTYPLAKRIVFDEATKLAVEADTKATESLEKLKPTPNGKSSGVGGTSNTTKSSKAA